jgi:phage I-like protein
VDFGYLTSVQSIELDEATDASWVHAMSIGKYQHPVFGELDFNPTNIQEFADSVNKRVRGIDPDIDYDHKQDPTKGNEAAGWVKKAEARNDGLWLLVEWTKTAASKIKEKAYKYFSPTFKDEWDDAHGNKFRNVVFGGALTNRPFLKDLVPVNLSEYFVGPPVVPNPHKEGDGMDPKVLRQMLGLAESATDAEVTAKIKTLTEPPKPPTPNDPKVLRATLGLAETATDDEVAAKLKALTEGSYVPPTGGMTVEEALAALSESANNPGLKALTDLVSAQQEELTALHKKNRTADIEAKLKELDEDIAGFKVPPVVKNHLRYVMLNSPQAVADQVLAEYKKTLDLGLVDMTEKGWVRRNADQTPKARFEVRVKELMEKDKMEYADAVQAASALDPELYTEYRHEAYSFREN